MTFVRVGDVELWVEERGSGGTPVLLIAGIPAVASDWAAVAEPLSERRRVVAFDNRGSGRSGVTPGRYTTRGLAADAVGLLDVLGIERADVFGMSLGGMVAQEVALGWPERVRRLVLGCTNVGLRHAVLPSRAVGEAFALRTDDWSLRMRTLAPFAFSRGATAELVDALVAKKVQDAQDPAGYVAQVEAVRSHDALDRLAGVKAPTLVITGDDDQVIPAANSERIAERIPGAELAVIAGAGHLFFIERPAETVARLEEFL